MKPRPATAEIADRWPTWPTLDGLARENPGLKLHQLRALLVPVPCYRCKDNTVRYEPEAAAAALAGDLNADDELDELSQLAGEMRGAKGTDYLLLVRELTRMVSDARKDKNDTIRLMEAPMRMAISLIETTNGVLVKRLEHHEGLWDSMISLIESVKSQDADRELQRDDLRHKQKVREGVLGTLKSNLPRIVGTAKLLRSGQLAVSILDSFTDEELDELIASQVFDEQKTAQLRELRLLRKVQKKPETEPPASSGPNDAAAAP